MKAEESAYVRYRLQRGEEALEEARLLVESGHLLTAVNRLYYACFYCVSALLLTEGRTTSKHSGVRALFDREWVNSGRVPLSLGEFYRRIFSHRQKADYADLASFRAEEVTRWLNEAVSFVGEISKLIEERLGGADRQT